MVRFTNLFHKHYNIRVRRYIKLHKLTCKIVLCILKFNFVLRHWFKHIWLTARTDGTSVVAKHNTWFGTVCYRISTIRLLCVGYTCKTYLNEKNCKSKTPIDWNKDFLIQVHCKWKSPRKIFSLQYAINIVKKR